MRSERKAFVASLSDEERGRLETRLAEHLRPLIDEAPADDAYRTDLAEAALEGIEEDATGEDFTKGTVEVTPKGE